MFDGYSLIADLPSLCYYSLPSFGLITMVLVLLAIALATVAYAAHASKPSTRHSQGFTRQRRFGRHRGKHIVQPRHQRETAAPDPRYGSQKSLCKRHMHAMNLHNGNRFTYTKGIGQGTCHTRNYTTLYLSRCWHWCWRYLVEDITTGVPETDRHTERHDNHARTGD